MSTDAKRSLPISIALHLALFLAIWISSFQESLNLKPYTPSIRVDLVDLPRHRVNENIPLPPQVKEIESTEPASKPVVTKTESDDEFATSKKKEKKTKDKLKSALDRIKALEKIKSAQSTPDLIRGNVVSKGSSVSGDAKTSGETEYFDQLLEHVKTRWELPRYLQNQPFSAQVLLKIDRTGQLLGMKFVKASGNEQFDQEVRRTINQSAPFPAPPLAMVPELKTQGILLGFPM